MGGGGAERQPKVSGAGDAAKPSALPFLALQKNHRKGDKKKQRQAHG